MIKKITPIDSLGKLLNSVEVKQPTTVSLQNDTTITVVEVFVFASADLQQGQRPNKMQQEGIVRFVKFTNAANIQNSVISAQALTELGLVVVD